MVSIPTVVMTPPKHPNFSMRMTSAPALLAAKAADRPEGPPPTTSTSHLLKEKSYKGYCHLQFIFFLT